MQRNSIFRPLYLTIILPDTQKFSRPSDRKTAVVSYTKILASATAFDERYKKGWSLTCEALLKLLLNPPVPSSASDNVIEEHDVDDSAFGVGFTQLNTCKRPARDPFPEIGDVKAWVGQYLSGADGRSGGRVSRYIQERLSPEAKGTLMSYMQG